MPESFGPFSRGQGFAPEASAAWGFNDDYITTLDFCFRTTPELFDPLTSSSNCGSPRLPRLTTIHSKWRNPATVCEYGHSHWFAEADFADYSIATPPASVAA
jgi:hypothetical protein